MHSKDDILCYNILESVNKILDISKKFSTVEGFADDYISFDAALMNFIIIGEMSGKLSDEFRNANSQIDWFKIHGFRNMIAHDYFGIDNKVVWQIIKTKIPQLKDFLDKLLSSH